MEEGDCFWYEERVRDGCLVGERCFPCGEVDEGAVEVDCFFGEGGDRS